MNMSNCSQTNDDMYKIAKLVMISVSCHNIGQLLLLMIYVNSKNCTILIIDKEIITKQNWLS